MLCLTFSIRKKLKVFQEECVKPQKSLQNNLPKMRFSRGRKAKDCLSSVALRTTRVWRGHSFRFRRKGNELISRHKICHTVHRPCDLLYPITSNTNNLIWQEPRGYKAQRKQFGHLHFAYPEVFTKAHLRWLTAFPSFFSFRRLLLLKTHKTIQAVPNNSITKLTELTTAQDSCCIYVTNTAKHSTGRLPFPFLPTPRMADSYICKIHSLTIKKRS